VNDCVEGRLLQGVIVKVLKEVEPTPEQMPMILNSQAPIMIIRGAAGSGKTTTALLRLKQLVGEWTKRKERLGIAEPVKILVLTFNRTLRGYIKELAESQIDESSECELEISTFAKWAVGLLGNSNLINSVEREAKIRELCIGFTQPMSFLVEEAIYVMERLLPEKYETYIDINRRGRGKSPRMTKEDRDLLLRQVVYPYQQWKSDNGLRDWNDLALDLYYKQLNIKYDVILADECQDFSGNQMRALGKYCSEVSAQTYILDAAQRIYPKGYTWKEVGIEVNPNYAFNLGSNHRNTKQIARFARAIISDLEIEDDGALPDFDSCVREGELPKVIIGTFSEQLQWVMSYIDQNIDLDTESLAFLHPKGGGWFDAIRTALSRKGIDYEEFTKRSEWPTSDANVALCTMHSAKGLEFDNIIIIGLNQELTPHGMESDDTSLNNWRRLTAMAIGRAKNSVVVGYKSSEASTLVNYLDESTYEEIEL